MTLASSDPFPAPHINPNFLSTPFDVAAMRSIVRAVQRFAAARAWSAFLAGPTGGLEHVRTDRDADIDAWARDQTITIWHPTGTAAMAGCGSAAGGVVNPDLTVKGVEGLRVVDASVFVSGIRFWQLRMRVRSAEH